LPIVSPTRITLYYYKKVFPHFSSKGIITINVLSTTPLYPAILPKGVKHCDKCGNDAVTLIRYSGAHLCDLHFREFFMRRVKREVRKQCDMKEGGTLAVALSGGKDSVVALHALHEIFREHRGVQLLAITVDEGVIGYRPDSIGIAARNCEELGVEHVIISFKEEFGMTLDEMCQRDRILGACSYCGVLRRRCMNKVAKERGAKVLATGLNLDDTAQSILMNFVRGEVEKLARLGPHTKAQEGLVPRIQPLRMIPEKETYLYAYLRGIEIHEAECPYAIEALRGKFRTIINGLEKDTPGTRHAILQSFEQLRETLAQMYPPAELGACGNCGEPTNGKLCQGCQLLDELRGEAE